MQIPPKARDAFRRGLQRLSKDDPTGSLKHFSKALQNFPEYYEAYYNQGVAEMKLGRTGEALQSFQQAIDLSGGSYARAIFGYGLGLARQGKPKEAEPIVRRALEAGPTIADGHVVLSIVLFQQHRLEEAEKSVREALLLGDPTSRKAYLVLADIHSERADYRAQVSDLETYLKLEPTDPNKEYLRVALGVAQRSAAKNAATIDPKNR